MNMQEKRNALKSLLREYLESYAQNKGAMQMRLWLAQELQEHLPGKSSDEITQITDEIITSLNIHQEKAQSLRDAINHGKSKEKWFTDEINNLTSDLSEQEKAQYIAELGNSVSKVKSELITTIIDTPNGVTKIPSTPKEIAAEIGNTALMGQLITDDIILSSDETINTGTPKVQEVIKDELQSGNDLGLKAAVAGASYTAADKGIVDIPKENRSGICASIGQTIVEKVKVAGGFVANTVGEGINRLEHTVVSNVVGGLVAIKGTLVGTALVGTVGTALFGSITGVALTTITAVLAPEILYSAGKKLGDIAVDWIHKEKHTLVKKTVEVLKKGAEVAVDTVKNVGKSLLKLVGFA